MINRYWNCIICGFKANNEQEKKVHLLEMNYDEDHRELHRLMGEAKKIEKEGTEALNVDIGIKNFFEHVRKL